MDYQLFKGSSTDQLSNSAVHNFVAYPLQLTKERNEMQAMAQNTFSDNILIKL